MKHTITKTARLYLAVCCLLIATLLHAQPNITAAEYFFDNDPGFGKATNITLTPGKDVTNISFAAPLAALGGGIHFLNIRSKNANGVWSITNQVFMYRSGSGGVPSNIVKAEYFFDTDHGFGKAINIPLTPGQDVSNISFSAPIDTLSGGIHFLNIRSMDIRGVWSVTNRVLMYRSGSGGTVPNITQIEYFVDSDPGIGKAVPIAINQATNLPNFVVPINISGLSTGDHNLYIRSRTERGWSITNIYPFPIAATASAPFINVNAIPKKLLCANDQFDISYDARGTFTAGTVFRAELSNAAGSFATPTLIASYTGKESKIIRCQLPLHMTGGTGYKIRVSSTSPAVTGKVSDTLLTIRDRPNSQAITGRTEVNGSDTWPYSVPTVAGSTWNWTMTGGTVSSGQNTASTQLNWSQPTPLLLNGQVVVLEINQYGCVGDSSILPVSVYRLNITNTVPASICPANIIAVKTGSTGVYNTGNSFIAELSNASGNFASPLASASVTASGTGVNQLNSINLPIPAALPNGTGYRVRVRSTNPAFIGDTTGNINIVTPDIGPDQGRQKCIGFTYNLASGFNEAGISYTYFTQSFANVPNAATVEAGVYQVIGTNTNGCKDTVQVTVTNYPKPDLGTDLVRGTCQGFGYNLTQIYNGAGLSFVYRTQAFGTVANPASVSAGIYQIIATNADGCKDTAQVTVTTLSKPNIGANKTAPNCVGSTYNLATGYTDASLIYTYFTQAFVAVPNPAAVGNGVYNVIGTNIDGCADTAVVTVTNAAKPNLGANISRSKCANESFDLTTVYTMAGLSYGYFSASYETLVTPAAVPAGAYNIIATNSLGCADTALVTVTDNAVPDLGADTTVYHVCLGETTNLLPLYNTTGLTATWNTANAAAAPPGFYRLLATNSFGCTDTAFANIVLETAQWTGTASADWHTAANWSTGKIPTERTHVIVATSTPNICTISTANAKAASVQAKNGATIRLQGGYQLDVNGKCESLP